MDDFLENDERLRFSVEWGVATVWWHGFGLKNYCHAQPSLFP